MADPVTYWESHRAPHRLPIEEAVRLLSPIRSLMEIGACCGPNLRLIKPLLGDAAVHLVDRDKAAMEYGAARLKLGDRLVIAQRDVADPAWWADLPTCDVVLTCWLLSELEYDAIEHALQGIRTLAERAIVHAEPAGIVVEAAGWTWQRLYVGEQSVRMGVRE